MSSSPERMSSYRRHFETGAPVYQLRASSPSPARRGSRQRSASFNQVGRRMDRRSTSNRPRMSSLGTLFFGLGPKLDLDAAAAENQEFMATRTTERKEMVVLNDRLAVYIEKVRTLESHNKLLEAEIEMQKSRHVRPSELRQIYESQLMELNRDADRLQRDSSLAAKEAMLNPLDALKAKHIEAVEARKNTEHEIEALRPEVDKATSGRIVLEKQLENLEAQLVFLQRVHKEEIEELMQQIYSITSKVDVTFGLPDLSSALRHIQSQYESIVAKNLQEMDAWYKTKFQDLNFASTRREEVVGYKKDILSKERELEAQKTRNEYLEARIQEAVDTNKKQEEDLQERMEALKLDLKVTREKIALLVREYQDLLNAKMALEIEITTYRKLIEGEDNRLSILVHNLSLTEALPKISQSSACTATSAAAEHPSTDRIEAPFTPHENPPSEKVWTET